MKRISWFSDKCFYLVSCCVKRIVVKNDNDFVNIDGESVRSEFVDRPTHIFGVRGVCVRVEPIKHY